MIYEPDLWLKSYDEGVSPEITIEDNSLVESFERIRKEFPNRVALSFLGVDITYEQLLQYADRFANCLNTQGIGKGDVTAICLPNSPQWVISFVGALKAGCAVSGVSPLYTPGEMAHQLKDSGAKALVCMDAIYEHRFCKVADQLPDVKLCTPTMLLDFLPWIKRTAAKLLKKVPTGKPVPLTGKKVISFMDVLKQYSPTPPKVEISQEDPFIIQYTGGTTGVPKGALCVHRNMLANVAQFDQWLKVEKGKETLASAFPMFHIAGLFTAIVGLCYGLTSILIPDPRNTKHIVGEMAKHKPNWMGNVPSLYMMLLNEPEFHKLDHSEIRFCVSGAAPFPVDAIKKFEGVIGKGKVIEVYGMTESCVLVTASPKEGEKKIGTVGLPLPSTRIMLVDIETGENEVPLGEEGEICSSGPQVMVGYHNKPQETANALREHHGHTWMHTGDIGVMDEQGYLRVVDRQKDMISVGGFKVFPREVEEKLYEHPAIELCAMVGLKNPDRPETEIVKLVVQKTSDYKDKPDEKVKEEIIAYCRENLAAYKVPKIIEFQEVPLTAAGKVDKKALR